MPEAKRKLDSEERSDLGLDGFEGFFERVDQGASGEHGGSTVPGERWVENQLEKLLGRFGELITLSVDQRVETAKLANQLIENQRQLIASQQILVRLMEKTIDLARHITEIEERLPAVFELPHRVENLRQRLAQLEGIELD